ncbi:MAG: CPBP family intramembrane glutamic endopeptidase [Leeuwenhoekiella sp.]
MFIEQAYKCQSEFWRYLLGSLLVIAASVVGQVPLLLALIFLKGPTILQGMDQNDMLTMLDSNLTFFLILIPFVIAFAALIFSIRFIHHQKLIDVTTSRKKFDWSRALFAFTLIGLFTIVTTGIDYFTNPQDYIFNFKLVPFLILTVLAILLVPIQTSLEEYLFRGYLMQGFGMLAKNKWFPLIMTSLIFGGLHFFNPEVGKLGNIIMVYYIGTGFLLGIMTLMDEGMELSLGFHAANNLITSILVTADWTAFQTESILKDISEPSQGFDVIMPVFIVYPIFLAILAFKYKWTGWRDKLFGKVTPPQKEIEEHLVAD